MRNSVAACTSYATLDSIRNAGQLPSEKANIFARKEAMFARAFEDAQDSLVIAKSIVVVCCVSTVEKKVGVTGVFRGSAMTAVAALHVVNGVFQRIHTRYKMQHCRRQEDFPRDHRYEDRRLLELRSISFGIDRACVLGPPKLGIARRPMVGDCSAAFFLLIAPRSASARAGSSSRRSFRKAPRPPQPSEIRLASLA